MAYQELSMGCKFKILAPLRLCVRMAYNLLEELCALFMNLKNYGKYDENIKEFSVNRYSGYED